MCRASITATCVWWTPKMDKTQRVCTNLCDLVVMPRFEGLTCEIAKLEPHCDFFIALKVTMLMVNG